MRDGRRNRLGLATGTANPNEEDVSTTGINSLINMGDLYTNSLADQNATTGNQAYLDRILEEQGPDTLTLDPGAYVNTRDNRYINDAYNYYLGGGTGDFADEVALTGGETIPGAVDTLVSGGDQDLATSGLGLGDNTPANTDFEQSLLDQGIGVQAEQGISPISAPGEGMLTQQAIDELADYPLNTSYGVGGADGMSGGQATPGAEFADQNPYGGDGINDLGADNFDTFEEVEPQSQLASEMIAERNAANRTDGLEDYLDGFDTVPEADNSIPDEYDQEINNVDFSKPNIGEISGPATMTVDELAASSADQGLDAFDPSAVSQAFTAGKQAIADGISTVAEVGQSIANTIGGIYNGEDQTISILGKEINIPTTLAGITLNQVVGAPISLAFNALRAIGGMLPEGGPTLQTGKAQSIGLAGEGQYQDIYGINTQSALGDYDQYNIDRVEDLETALDKARGKYSTEQEYLDMTTRMRKELEDRQEYNTISGAGGDIDDDPTGDAGIAEQIEADNRAAEAQAAAAREAEIDANREAARDAQNEQNAQNARDAAAAANAAATAAAQRELNRTSQYNRGNGGGGGGGGRGDSNSPGGGGSYCFDPSTPIQMADGSIKEIKNIQLGDDTKGGEVTGVFQFKASDDIHNYKGVTVAGGHYVKENNEFIMVKDSPLAVKMDKIPVVYSLDTSARRIFIKDIEFADYNGDGVAKNFLSNAGVTLEGFDKEVLRQVQQRLI